jgi:hypothetical protein
MKLWVKITLSVAGTALVSLSGYFGAHSTTWTVTGLIAALGTPIGTYLLGLFQNSPTNGGH